jgi:hypothetical protein
MLQNFIICIQLKAAQAALAVGKSPAQQRNGLFFSKLLQNVNASTGEQGAVNLERRIFGGRSNQANISALHVR